MVALHSRRVRPRAREPFTLDIRPRSSGPRPVDPLTSRAFPSLEQPQAPQPRPHPHGRSERADRASTATTPSARSPSASVDRRHWKDRPALPVSSPQRRLRRAAIRTTFTREDGEYREAPGAGSLRIRAVETGAPHAAIREDISCNLTEAENLTAEHAGADPPRVGGDNLAANWSSSPTSSYVIDVCGGDKIPRKGGPGVTQADLLVINKVNWRRRWAPAWR